MGRPLPALKPNAPPTVTRSPPPATQPCSGAVPDAGRPSPSTPAEFDWRTTIDETGARQHTRNTVGVSLAGVALLGYLAIPNVHNAVNTFVRTLTSGTSHSALAPQDQQFLTALDRQGFTYTTPGAAINTGRYIASLYDTGYTGTQLAAQIRSGVSADGIAFTAAQSQQLVETAIAAYSTRR